MLDNSLNDLEKQIKSIDYQDNYLIITMMNNSKKVITYSEEKLQELRDKMFVEYSLNKQKYLNALELATSFTENTKILSFMLMLGSFVFLYKIDAEIETKILAGLCFAAATMLHHLYKDYLKEKYKKLKHRVDLFSYYIDNIEEFKEVSEDGSENYSINIEEINHKGMTLKKLKGYANNNHMV